MRWFVLLWVGCLLVGGCARNRTAGDPTTGALGPSSGPAQTAAPSHSGGPLLVTPSTTSSGRVALVNPKARYIVISYPIGALPTIGQQAHVYRQGLKVAEVRISGPQRDFNIAADIEQGECAVGDEVRAK